MKKIFLTLAIIVALYFGVCGGFATRTTYAQCGCSCGMMCGNRCEFACYDCTLSQAIDLGYQCCVEAHRQTGDTEPCPDEGGGVS
jgi:hypothetical protein